MRYSKDQIHLPPIIDHILQPKQDILFTLGHHVLWFSIEQQLAEPIIMEYPNNHGILFRLQFLCRSNLPDPIHFPHKMVQLGKLLGLF